MHPLWHSQWPSCVPTHKKKWFFKLKGRKHYDFPNCECEELWKLTATEQKEARLILLLEVLSQLINKIPKFTPHYQPPIPIVFVGALLALRELGWPVGGLCRHLFGWNITQIQVAMPISRPFESSQKPPCNTLFRESIYISITHKKIAILGLSGI